MLNEVSRLTKAWLASTGPFGLSQMLSEIAIAPGDDRPEPPLAIYCDAEDACVADDVDPDAKTSIVIMADGNPSSPVERNKTHYEARRLPVAFLYCIKDTPTIRARIDAGYILHAVMDSLWALGGGLRGGEARRMANVELMKWNEFVEVRASGQVGSANIVAAVLATAHVQRVMR